MSIFRDTGDSILAGILCTRSAWKRDLKGKITRTLKNLAVGQRLDLGCALEQAGFSATYGKRLDVSTSSPDTALVFFFLRLMARLQDAGTVAAIDLEEYEKAL